MDDSIKPDIYNRMPWYFSILEPWMQWANSAIGICKNAVTYGDGFTVNVYGTSGLEYEGFVDENNKACGFGTFRKSDISMTGSGTFWNGKGYGLLHREYKYLHTSLLKTLTIFVDENSNNAGPESYA